MEGPPMATSIRPIVTSVYRVWRSLYSSETTLILWSAWICSFFSRNSAGTLVARAVVPLPYVPMVMVFGPAAGGGVRAAGGQSQERLQTNPRAKAFRPVLVFMSKLSSMRGRGGYPRADMLALGRGQ